MKEKGSMNSIKYESNRGEKMVIFQMLLGRSLYVSRPRQHGHKRESRDDSAVMGTGTIDDTGIDTFTASRRYSPPNS